MPSAIAFNLDLAKISLFGEELTHYQELATFPYLIQSHTMTPFDAPRKQAF